MSEDGRPRQQQQRRPMLRTPLALAVLSLVNERAMHPYEMRSLMRERRHDRAFRIRESSVYDTVARLAERGLVEPVEVNREGRRPERTVYAITENGRDELLVWLWELASEPSAESPAFAVPLMFIYALGKDRAIVAFQQRAARLEAEISAAGAYRRAYMADMPGFPRIFQIEDEYAQAMRQAELAWVRGTVTELRDGTFPWPAADEIEKFAAQLKGDGYMT